MYTRQRPPFLQHMLSEFPKVAILGPHQVGKTTLALELVRDRPSTLYLDLESPADAAKLADPAVYFAALCGARGRRIISTGARRARDPLADLQRALVELRPSR